MKPADGDIREDAARDFSRNLAVTAGAGTGKTSLLIERLLHFIFEMGKPLERAAAITFTRKAASELRERLEDALERMLRLASDRPPAPDANHEADRVFERLLEAKVSRDRILALGRAAIQALDGAALGTIHSFAGALLRRHPIEAGVDAGFEEDEGSRREELFGELWPEYVEEALGPEEVPDGWRDLLARLSIEDVEEIARRLVDLGVPIEAIDPEGEDGQRACAAGLVEEWLGLLARIRKATVGVKSRSRNLDAALRRIETALAGLERGAALPCAAAGLPKSCKIADEGAFPGQESLDGELKDALSDIRKLAASDPAFARDAALALRPFVERFRGEYLRRGFISFDGLLVRARDLLRDHADVRREEGARFDHLLVDEFQDTDPLQYEIVFFLAEDPGARGPPAKAAFEARLAAGKLFIVGDPKQSIYHFRGADIRAYERAVKALERDGGEVLQLATNFRSVPELVAPLNALFEAVFDPRRTGHAGEKAAGLDPPFGALAPHRDPRRSPSIEIRSVGRPGLDAHSRREAEAKSVARWIHEEVGSSRSGKGTRWKDIALLTRGRQEWETYLRAFRSLDIPYVLQGGRGFFSRYEVELLVALLKVVASPSDPVALVACLRSPAGAVPDRELHLWSIAGREARNAAGPLWSLHARPKAADFPCLAQALEQLRSFADRHAGEPIDRVARAALDETPLRLAMAAMYDGAQRVLNLEKAARRIALLAADGRLSGAEILERIEEDEAMELAGGDSPLADETLDAVRVLTIHGAKGLEWPVVVLPNLVRDQGGRGKPVEAAIFQAARPLLALRAEGAETPASVARRIDESLHDAAELKRLLYVASTRARDRLLLVVGGARQPGPWIEALEAWGYRCGAGFPQVESLAGGAVLHRVDPDPKLPDRRQGAEADTRPLIDAARTFEKAVEEVAKATRQGFSSPSGIKEERLERDADGELLPPAADGGVSALAGTAVHHLLELWDRQDLAWPEKNAEQAVRVAAAAGGGDVAAALVRARAILAGLRRSGGLGRLAAEKAIGREVPMLYRDPDGGLWRGTIDCILGPPEAPGVVDYKTDAAATREDLDRRHGAQIAKYAEAVERAAGLKKRPACRVEALSERGA